jgi:phosphoribosylanthranilate isomerase
MIVKICGITNRDDAMAAVDAGASAIGFNFYRDSPRYISPTGAAMLAEKIPANVWKVGVFVNEEAEAVARVALQAGLDVAQLHGTSEARGMRVWQACTIGDWWLIGESAESHGVEALLVDKSAEKTYGGTGQTWAWPEARNIPMKFLIAGGLDAANVQQAIEEARPWGVDACSRIERAPGLKDHDKMRKFIKAALEAKA